MSEDVKDPWTPVPAPKLSALGHLQSVYSDPNKSDGARMRAAIEALPFESPKLAVTALMNGEAFAAALERAIARSGKVIERAEPPMIEAKPAQSK